MRRERDEELESRTALTVSVRDVVLSHSMQGAECDQQSDSDYESCRKGRTLVG